MKAVRLEDVFEGEPSPIASEWSHLEHMYSGPLSGYYYRRFDQALAAAELAPSHRTLLVGAGTGTFALSVAGLGAELYVTDVQKEAELFSTARRLFAAAAHLTTSEPTYVAADGTSLPLDSGSFDRVFALDVLEHVPDEDAALREIERVLRPAGRAVLSLPVEVGPVALVRECYRFIDGRRNLTQSLPELAAAVLGRPTERNPRHHRGYDYRETLETARSLFGSVRVEYCPVRPLRWLNLTAIATAVVDG